MPLRMSADIEPSTAIARASRPPETVYVAWVCDFQTPHRLKSAAHPMDAQGYFQPAPVATSFAFLTKFPDGVPGVVGVVAGPIG